MLLQDQALATLRGQVADIISGTVFVFLGLTACGIAAMRRRSGVRVLVWLGVWSVMYGVLRMGDAITAVAHLPHWFQVSVRYLDVVNMYFILVVATRAWMELSVGKLRVLLRALMFAALAIGVAGVFIFLVTGARNKLSPYNSLLAACILCVLVAVVAIPKLARKFLVVPDSRVLLVGTLVFAIEALYTNVARPLGYKSSSIWDSLGFAVLLLSFAYVALQMVFESEGRLLSIEKELAIAREIQASTLPSGSPEIENLCITAAYRPMTAVAGDFYGFLRIDEHRVGVLVADVSGHGVPAALIAAMLKVAMQSVVPCAHDPREVLRELNRALYGQLRDQFVTAAYLFLDTQNHKARYSAAGHPPLILLRRGRLERVESNGLVVGVMLEPDYPVHDMQIHSGDRFLLYTDGVIEAENAEGQAFGYSKVEEVILDTQAGSPSELVDRLLTEIRSWQPPTQPQQDDITLVVVDVR